MCSKKMYKPHANNNRLLSLLKVHSNTVVLVSIVTPIFKDDDPELMTKYRPITQSSPML